ncbi:Putative glycosyltransferase EpsD [Geobacteraceae bacterium]|nr:Putative glycosyltransferase EpsD [Geobacteraceae bacterium]
MKIALITPYHTPPVRGNAVTVRRIAAHLAAAGCEAAVYSLDAMTAADILHGIRQAAPAVIHAFHAHLGGRVAREVARAVGVPYIVTLTGSDVYEALEDGRREETLAVLHDAAAIVAFDASVKHHIADHHPSLAEKTRVIPQGVELPGDDFHWGEERFEAGEFVFFLPAGLRPVKNVGFSLPPLAELHREEPRVRLLVAGLILDEKYGATVLAELDRHPFARYLGVVGRDAIGALYRRADVILNTSRFEGGMANSVLEAMAFGRPVLAADIEGNRSIVLEGKTGLLYRDEGEFLRKARQLLEDDALRRHLGERGSRLVQERFSPEREAVAYRELYGRVLG